MCSCLMATQNGNKFYTLKRNNGKSDFGVRTFGLRAFGQSPKEVILISCWDNNKEQALKFTLLVDGKTQSPILVILRI